MLNIDPRKVRIAAVMVNAVIVKVVLIVAGYYCGKALDVRWHSTPYAMTTGICLGLGLGLWWILFTVKRFKL